MLAAACARSRPLAAALGPFDAWITGRKRYHGAERTALPPIEALDGRIKINPLAGWGAARIRAAFAEYGLPPHPLVVDGFRSVGCQPCTTGSPGEPNCAPAGGPGPVRPNVASTWPWPARPRDQDTAKPQ